MKDGMSYIAINKTGYCYAICSADPDNAEILAQGLKEWSRDGATIKLLTDSEALGMFCENVKRDSTDTQSTLF